MVYDALCGLVLLAVLLLLLRLLCLLSIARVLQCLLPIILLRFGDGLRALATSLICKLMQAELFSGITCDFG